MFQRRRAGVTRSRARRWALRVLATGGLAAAALTLGSGAASASDHAQTQGLGDVVGGLLGPVGDDVVDPLVEGVVSPVVGGVVAPVVEDVVAPVVEPVREAVAPVTDPVVRDVVTPVVEPVVRDVVAPVTMPVEDAVAPVTQPVEDALAPVTDPVEEVVAPIVSPTPREDAPPQDVAPAPPSDPAPGTEPGAPAPGEPVPAPAEEAGLGVAKPGAAHPAPTTTPVASAVRDEARDALVVATRDLGFVADSARAELALSLAGAGPDLAADVVGAAAAASEATVTAYDQVTHPAWFSGGSLDQEPVGPGVSSAPAPASSSAYSSSRALTSDVGALAGILLPVLCVVWLTVGRERLRLLERSLEVPTSPA